MKRPHVAMLTLSLALLSASAVAATAPLASAPVVVTGSGSISGRSSGGVAAFKGIPFAAPPVGNLRWREPQPPRAWPGVRAATAYAPACIQVVPKQSQDSAGMPARQSEDCLYLNVWSGALGAAAKRPVIVWIYGGAFTTGSSEFALYDGAPLARKGAVVVSFNYRLLQLGFFVHPALDRAHPGGPANFGLLDQIAALRWVKTNIARFGGDPANVTIAGESAGAKSVLALFVSPLARGLFAKGIAMSSYSVPELPLAKARERGINTAKALGLPGSAATLAQLRAVPAAQFARFATSDYVSAPVPIGGDSVLPSTIAATFAAGKEAAAPLVLGNTSDDASVAKSFGLEPAEVLAKIRGAHLALRVLYPGVGDQNELARQAARDLVFTTQVGALGDEHAKRAPAFRYYFDYVAVKDRSRLAHGVPHGGEIAYFLNTGDLAPHTRRIFTDADRAYAKRTSDYIVSFARTGSPSANGAPAWTASSAGSDRTLVFGPSSVALQNNFMRARLSAFIRAAKLLSSLTNPR